MHQTQQAEFFRHLRPYWFSKNRLEIVPLVNGGISFLLSPVASKTYDYWVYICPENVPFSLKTSVHRLREIKSSGTEPWGRIVLDSRPVIDVLCESASQPKLPSAVPALIEKFKLLNKLADEQLQEALRNANDSISAYDNELANIKKNAGI